MVLGYAVGGPRLRHRLEGADQQLARIFLVIGAFIGDAHHRHAARQLLYRFGHDVEMLRRMERDVDADRPAQAARPHARRYHDPVRLNGAAGSLNAYRCSILQKNPGDLGVFEYPGASFAGAGGESLGDVDGIDLTILREKYPADRAGKIVMRQTFVDLAEADDVHFEAETLGHGSSPHQLFHAAVV